MKGHNYIHMWFKSWDFRSNDKLFKEKRNGWYIKKEKRLPGIKHRRDGKEASCSCVWNQLFPQIPSMEVHVSAHRTGPSSSGLPCPIEFNLGLFQIASYSACLHTDRDSWGSEACLGLRSVAWPSPPNCPLPPASAWGAQQQPLGDSKALPIQHLPTPIEANLSSWLSDTCVSCWASKFFPPEDKQGLCSWNI